MISLSLLPLVPALLMVAALIAATVRAKVTLVERHKMGGDCLNTGCVPSKALIRSAKLLSQIARSGQYGIRRAEAEFDFAEVMERVQRVIKAIEPHDSVERYTGLGVDVVQGTARITSPWDVFDVYRITHGESKIGLCEYDWFVDSQGANQWPAWT